MVAEAHGRIAYGHGCRCAVCREANTEYSRRWRDRKRGLGLVPDCGENLQAPRDHVSSWGLVRVVAGVRAEIGLLPAAASRIIRRWSRRR